MPVKEASVNRALPYILRTSQTDAIIFSSVDEHGQLGFVLSLVDGGVGRAVDAHVYLVMGEAFFHGILVADVQRVNIGEIPMMQCVANGDFL
jgi:hypothetical protein